MQNLQGTSDYLKARFQGRLEMTESYTLYQIKAISSSPIVHSHLLSAQ
jgi:hypothetical protein